MEEARIKREGKTRVVTQKLCRYRDFFRTLALDAYRDNIGNEDVTYTVGTHRRDASGL